MNAPPTISGVLPINKAYAKTSMSVCRTVKARLRNAGAPKRIKVGHAGTLDPLATGVIVVLVGKATKLCDTYMGSPKRYTTTIDLAHTSNTDDHEGELTPATIHTPPTLDTIESTLPAFTGIIQQAPPAHSAIKVNGERAYTLARAGKLDTLETRPVRIDSIDIIEYAFPKLVLDVRCGKGTYLRSLARDIGIALGTGGMLQDLCRTQVGPFEIKDCVSIDDLPNDLTAEHLRTTPELDAILAKLAAQSPERSDTNGE